MFIYAPPTCICTIEHGRERERERERERGGGVGDRRGGKLFEKKIVQKDD